MALKLALNVAAIIAAAIMIAHVALKSLQNGRTYRKLFGPRQQWRIPLAFAIVFYMLIIAECLLLAQQQPTWAQLGKAAVGISYSFYQVNLAPWNQTNFTRVLVSLPLNMWMLAIPFLQCHWWLFGVSTGTCTVCAIMLHHGDLGDSFFFASLIAVWLAAQAMVGLGSLFTVSFAIFAASIVVFLYERKTVLSELTRVLCQVAAYTGFIGAACIGVMAMAITRTWVSSLVRLALTLPAILGLVLVQWVLNDLEVERQTQDRIFPSTVGKSNSFWDAVLWPYLVWSILLPFNFTFTNWPVLAVTEVVGFAWAAVGIVFLMDRKEVELQLVAQYGILHPLVGTVLPLGVVWWSGEMPHLLETVQPWVFYFVPATLGVIYVWAEFASKLFERSDIVFRLLVVLVLLAMPWALALDTAELQLWAPTLDMYPADFVTFHFGPNETWKDTKTWHFPNTTWHSPKQWFLRMPRPTWPELANITSIWARAKFWIPFMAIKLFCAIVLAVLVLWLPCRKD